MLDTHIESIDEAALQQLVDNAVSERRDLEFKRDLPDQQTDNVREFLADVSALANTVGGDLIFGIEEDGGVAGRLYGVEVADHDALILRYENIIRDGIAPRLTGIRIKCVPLASGSAVVVVRIPRGLQPPHRVIYRNSGRFFARTSRGKYEPDVHELRHMFIDGDRLPMRFRQLHHEAIERARGFDMPFGTAPNPTAVVSTIPLSLFRDERTIPITSADALVPINTSGYSSMEMIEGVMMYSTVDAAVGNVDTFAITYRNGRTDVAWTIGRSFNGLETLLAIPSWFEAGLVNATLATQTRLQQFGIEGPWVVQVSVLGVRNFQIRRGNFYTSRKPFKDEEFIGELRLERIEADALLPIAKNFWLMFGEHRPEDVAIGAPFS